MPSLDQAKATLCTPRFTAAINVFLLWITCACVCRENRSNPMKRSMRAICGANSSNFIGDRSNRIVWVVFRRFSTKVDLCWLDLPSAFIGPTV